MKKAVIVLIVSVALILSACLIGCNSSNGVNGTYYLYENGEFDKSEFIKLSSGKWSDDEDASGTYKLSGDNITFYIEMFGSSEELFSGKLSDGKLTVTILNSTRTYYIEGKEPGGSEENPSEGETPQKEQFTVTYDANGGAFADDENSVTQKVNKLSKLTAPTSPVRSNYKFAGWAKNRSGSSMWKFEEDIITEDTTLYAQWTQESAVILSVEGASIEDKSIFMLVDNDTDRVSLSSKVVCSDDSIWRLYSDSEGQREIPTKMVTNLANGDNTYYIVVSSQNQAQVNVYEFTVHRSYYISITYIGVKGVTVDVDHAYTGELYEVKYVPDIAGYTFNFWKNAWGEKITEFTPYSPVQLFADVTANKYTITLNASGGSVKEETKEVVFGDEYSLPVPSREGHTFNGWYFRDTPYTDNKGKCIGDYSYADNITLTASWTANTYNVNVTQSLSDAGTISGAGEYVYGKAVKLTATINEGYAWVGWFDSHGELLGNDLTYSFTMGLNVNITAKWIACPVTLNKDLAEGGSVSGVEKTIVGKETTITAKTNSGYTWVGWFNEDSLLTNELSYTFDMPSEKVTYTAKWIKVTLAKSDNSAGTISSLKDKYKAGQSVTITAETNSGYTFLGWYDEDRQLSNELSYTFDMPSENVTYTAKWIKYPITLNRNLVKGGSVSGEERTIVGKETTITAETNLGYTFLGWYDEEDNLLTDELSYTFDMPSENVTYTAKWKVSDEMSNFTFISDTSQYRITGIIDKTVETIVVPEYVTSIDNGAFSGCGKLKSITIPFVGGGKAAAKGSIFFGYIFGNESYEGGASTYQRYSDGSYSEYFYIPASLETVTILGDTIGRDTFYNCSNLTSITIGDKVTSIGNSAFYQCYSLTSVTIGKNVLSIGKMAFHSCYKLIEVCNKSILDIQAGQDTFGYVGYYAKNVYKPEEGESKLIEYEDYTFYADDEKNEYYLVSYKGEEVSLTLPEDYDGNAYEIYRYAFYNNNNIESVTIGDNVTSIGRWAFEGCINLTNAYFKNPNGWEILLPSSLLNVPSEDLEDPTRAAKYLSIRGYYSTYGWERK